MVLLVVLLVVLVLEVVVVVVGVLVVVVMDMPPSMHSSLQDPSLHRPCGTTWGCIRREHGVVHWIRNSIFSHSDPTSMHGMTSNAAAFAQWERKQEWVCNSGGGDRTAICG